MNRLVYLYVSNGSCDPDNIPKWNIDHTSLDPFAFHFTQEGFCFLFNALIKKKILQDVLVVIESARFPGSKYVSGNMTILVVPHLRELWKFLEEDDILWVRGGWRGWWVFLKEWHDLGRWLLFYRAASNRGAWEFWDIVFDDLKTTCAQDKVGRFYYPINKPIDPTLFFPMTTERIYDLCVGASHIHEKKGQFKIVPVLDAYEKKYKKRLKCVLPGGMRHSHSDRILRNTSHDILITGTLPKDELRKVYNQSKIFIHCGTAGQNDRGPLEAMACGTPVMLSNEQYHPEFMNSRHTSFSFHVSIDEPEIAAQQINFALNMVNEAWRTSVKRYFEAENGVGNVIIPQFERIFSLIARTPHKKRQELFNQLLEKQTQMRSNAL